MVLNPILSNIFTKTNGVPFDLHPTRFSGQVEPEIVPNNLDLKKRNIQQGT